VELGRLRQQHRTVFAEQLRNIVGELVSFISGKKKFLIHSSEIQAEGMCVQLDGQLAGFFVCISVELNCVVGLAT